MLAARGILVMRFENFHVRTHASRVSAAIQEVALLRAALLLAPSPLAGRVGVGVLEATGDKQSAGASPSTKARRQGPISAGAGSTTERVQTRRST
jgi:hypothetical protein